MSDSKDREINVGHTPQLRQGIGLCPLPVVNMVKNLGPLKNGIVRRPLPKGLIARAHAVEAASRAFDEKLQLLFEKYDVKEDDFKHLAICLAMDFIPGFKPTKVAGQKKGKPRKWTPELEQLLITEFEKRKDKCAVNGQSWVFDQICKLSAFKIMTAHGLRARMRILKKS